MRFSLFILAMTIHGLLHGQQTSSVKVYISADMEGIGGVSTGKQANNSGLDYSTSRRLMTLEVNAAINGAYEAGATEVLVSDSHGDGQNIDVELLDKRVKLIRAWPRPLGMMQGIDASFAAAVFVGYHASEGQANAILSHTSSGAMFSDVKLNGVTVPEAGFNAAIAGEFGVPVVFLSGDQTIGEEAKRLLGPIETATVKVAESFFSATMISPEESQRLIRDGVKRGVQNRQKFKPYKLSRPIKLEMTFKRTAVADVVSFFQNTERPRGNVIVYNAKDIIDASKFFNAIENLRVE